MRRCLLFVYGTLRSGSKQTWARALVRQAEYVSRGYIHGRLYHLGRYPGAVCRRGPDRVIGDLYRLRDVTVLRQLDVYEGCDPLTGVGREYRRTVVPVTRTDTGQVLKAWVYLYRRPVGCRPRIVTGDWLEAIQFKNSSITSTANTMAK